MDYLHTHMCAHTEQGSSSVRSPLLMRLMLEPSLQEKYHKKTTPQSIFCLGNMVSVTFLREFQEASMLFRKLLSGFFELPV